MIFFVQSYSSQFDLHCQIKSFSAVLRSGPQSLASSSLNGYLGTLRNLSDIKSGVIVPFLLLFTSSINLIFVVGILFYLSGFSIISIFALASIYYFFYFYLISPVLSKQSDKLSRYLQAVYTLPASILANYKPLILDSTLPKYFDSYIATYRKLKLTDSFRSSLLSLNRPLLEFVSLSSICIYIIIQFSLGNQALIASNLSILLLAFFKILPLTTSISSSFGYLKSNNYLINSSLQLSILPEASLPIPLSADSVSAHINSKLPFYLSEVQNSKFFLDIESLSFGFTKSTDIFHDFSYHFDSSSLYIITGPSGIGKSTFFDIVSGLIPARHGDFCFSDIHKLSSVHLQKSNVGYWRQLFSFVQQRPTILENNVYDFMTNPHFALNNKYSRYTIPTCSEVRDAMQAYELSEFYNDPDNPSQYYPVRNYGQNLSGGQLQRLALAKVSLMPDPVILMDEPTSALDPNLTQLVASNIINMSKNKIVIVISHDSFFLEYFSVSPTDSFTIHCITV